jgi:hypothetical protein
MEKSVSARFQRARYTFSVATELKRSYPDISMALAFSSIETLELGEKNQPFENIKGFFNNTPNEIKESFLTSQNKYFLPSEQYDSTFDGIIDSLWQEFRCNFLHDGFWHWHPEFKNLDDANHVHQFYFLTRERENELEFVNLL